jgi:CO dehydrogenase maturation factor
VRGVLDAVPADRTVVVDLEASPEHFSRAATAYVDTMLLVAEPYFKSLETARRYHELATGLEIPRVALLANRVRGGDAGIIDEFCDRHGFELAGRIPQDDGFQTAERLGVAPIDHDPASPGVQAVAELAKRLGDDQP